MKVLVLSGRFGMGHEMAAMQSVNSSVSLIKIQKL